ncbi:MAG: Rieske 2Fe-2S domain-containing protein [Halieaceae bacterium]|jgi:nitrite reductase/ring-hydroxylating ferredoxin subunit|nr:Rieske 2Fe-2S domain-containing protein [Halieaceae bacterium]
MSQSIQDPPADPADGNPLPLERNTSASVTVDGIPLIIADHNGRLFAYENLCPHANETLDPQGGSLSSADGALLRCQRHAAEFLSTTGECVSGPCLGERLRPVAIVIVDREVYLD